MREYHFFQSCRSRMAYLVSALIVLLFTLLGLHFVWPLGVLMLVFLVPITLFLVKRFFLRRELFTVDAAGITDRTAVICAGHIPWSEIVAFRLYTNDRFVVLQVAVTSYEAFCGRFQGLHRAPLRLNGRIHTMPIQIYLARRDCDPNELLPVLRAQYARHHPEAQ